MRRCAMLPVLRFLLCVTMLWTVAKAARAQEAPYLKSFQLQHVSSEQVAGTLQALIPEVVVNEDSTSNMIHVFGTDEVHAQIADWLQELDGEPQAQQLRIFPLSHRGPEETEELLTRILKDDPRVGTVSVVPDERSQALIVRTTEAEFEYIEQLLRVIDTEPAAAMDVKVFQLNNAEAPAVSELIHDMFSNAAIPGMDETGQLRVAVDERTNSVIVTGPRDALSVVEALLLRLDEGGDPPVVESEPSRIRILWIVSGDEWTGDGDRQPQLTAMPADLADVAGELDSLGISNPQIATQMIVNTSADFSIAGSAQLENPVRVRVDGTLSRESPRGASRPTMRISIHVEELVFTGNPTAGSTCELETQLKAPLGHFVVLGVSPMDGRNSAFVVQVSEIAQ